MITFDTQVEGLVGGHKVALGSLIIGTADYLTSRGVRLATLDWFMPQFPDDTNHALYFVIGMIRGIALMHGTTPLALIAMAKAWHAGAPMDPMGTRYPAKGSG